jgi:DNA-binding PadR family transcriptional regulator
MDKQLKRGFLEICVLAALKNDDLYGYKLIEVLRPYIYRNIRINFISHIEKARN